MDTLPLIILAFIQGMTEFIPVSSSVHLALLPLLTAYQAPDLLLIVALHVGTLGAVLLYFRATLFAMITSFFALLGGRFTEPCHQALRLITATIPVVIGGYIIHKFFKEQGPTSLIMGISSIVFGLLMYWSDRYSTDRMSQTSMTYFQAFIIGLGQVIAAAIPGASRSGCCFTIARFLGFKRTVSMSFSFLLSIPTIVAAATLMMNNLPLHGISLNISQISLVLGISLLVGILGISFMMTWVKRHGIFLFAAYRVVLGVILVGNHFFPYY